MNTKTLGCTGKLHQHKHHYICDYDKSHINYIS